MARLLEETKVNHRDPSKPVGKTAWDLAHRIPISLTR